MTTLTPDRWQQVRAVLDAALELPPDRRAGYVALACGSDAELRAEVDQMLNAAARSEDFLSRPASELASSLIASEAGASLAPGDHIGPYRIVRTAGQGGMGTVYLAEREDQYRKRVALKVVRSGMENAETHWRFVAERQILANMEHPAIARLLDGGVTGDGHPYFVMEFVDGVPIDRYCDTGRLGVEQRLALFVRVCEAVRYAHRKLIVHRDLKPSNILITEEGEVRLLDFGIAKLLTPESKDAPRTAVRVLTPEYASPEQIEGEPVSPASDVYSLGVMLYRLLTGRHPYDIAGRTAQDVVRAVLQTIPDTPSASVSRMDVTSAEATTARATTPERLRRRLAGDLDAIMLKALEKSPERRYASAEAMLDDVVRHMDRRPISARRGTFLYRTHTLVRRHHRSFAAASLIVLAFFAGALCAVAPE